MSNSTQLFRSIFRNIEYSKDGGNYTFQSDPTGDDNDRIFPVINLRKMVMLKRIIIRRGLDNEK